MDTGGNEPTWIAAGAAMLIHSRQLAEHGGLDGVHDENALESALARPRNAYAYGESDLAALAASYAFGIARNHPFSDGNKRTAYVISVLFLELNGQSLSPDKQDAISTFLALAGGELSENELADWFRQRLAQA